MRHVEGEIYPNSVFIDRTSKLYSDIQIVIPVSKPIAPYTQGEIPAAYEKDCCILSTRNNLNTGWNIRIPFVNIVYMIKM